MSLEALQWAFRQRLPSSEKAVLIALAWHHNSSTGRLDPSEKLLAADTGLHKRTVQRMLKELSTRGFIKITVRHCAESRRLTSNFYALIVSNNDSIDGGPPPPLSTVYHPQAVQHRPLSGVLPPSVTVQRRHPSGPPPPESYLDPKTEKENEQRVCEGQNSEAVRGGNNGDGKSKSNAEKIAEANRKRTLGF